MNKDVFNLYNKVTSELKEEDGNDKVGNPVVDNLTARQLRKAVATTPALQRDVEARILLLSKAADDKLTIEFIERHLHETRDNVLYTESAVSGIKDGLIEEKTMDSIENVTDISGATPEYVDAGMSRNTNQGQDNMLSVADYFERPVQIYSTPIVLGTDVTQKILVWDKWSLVPSVRAKLRNYAFFRGDLMVKMIVTGTPFHFGRGLYSYQPYAGFNETLTSYSTNYALSSTIRPCYLNYLSQAEGSGTINFNENQPVVLRCPFISTKPMHRIFNNQATAISDVTSLVDFVNAGALYFFTLNQAQAVSDSSSNISLSIYAWVENIELGAPTGTVMQVTTESGKSEYVTGPVEKIATRLADISGALTRVPELAPFAYASSIAFKGLAGVAAIFGWSKPPPDPEPTFIKQMPYTPASQCIGYDTNYKISIDPHQELTVDPRVVGSTKDEMTISHICERETWWVSQSWATTDATFTPIWGFGVTPWCVTGVTHGTVSRNYIQPTAVAFAAQPFFWWRGEMTFRFDFVCSAFHRGKIAIVFEPNVSQSVLIMTAADVSLNKQSMVFVDLQETQSVEICVKWASMRPWLKVGTGPSFEDSSAAIPNGEGYFNGFFFLMPVTRLTSPLEKTIDVNVFVKSTNMQFQFLSEDAMPAERRIYTESGIASVPVSCVDINKSSATTSHISEDYFGENPVSFRLLMKRFARRATLPITTSSGTSHVIDIINNNVPVLRAAYNTAPSSTPLYNLFDYLRYAYLGVRGGIRRRYRMASFNSNQWHVVSNYGPTTYVPDSISDTTTAGLTSPIYLKGSAEFCTTINAGVEVELPFYTSNLFVFSFSNTLDGGVAGSQDDMETTWMRSHKLSAIVPVASTALAFDDEIATGEDFTFLRFQGAPYYSHTN